MRRQGAQRAEWRSGGAKRSAPCRSRAGRWMRVRVLLTTGGDAGAASGWVGGRESQRMRRWLVVGAHRTRGPASVRRLERRTTTTSVHTLTSLPRSARAGRHAPGSWAVRCFRKTGRQQVAQRGQPIWAKRTPPRSRRPGGVQARIRPRGARGANWICCPWRAPLRVTPWLSFSTAQRKGSALPSHFERSLLPALPGLPVGVSRRFRAMACVSRSRLA